MLQSVANLLDSLPADTTDSSWLHFTKCSIRNSCVSSCVNSCVNSCVLSDMFAHLLPAPHSRPFHIQCCHLYIIDQRRLSKVICCGVAVSHLIFDCWPMSVGQSYEVWGCQGLVWLHWSAQPWRAVWVLMSTHEYCHSTPYDSLTWQVPRVSTRGTQVVPGVAQYIVGSCDGYIVLPLLPCVSELLHAAGPGLACCKMVVIIRILEMCSI